MKFLDMHPTLSNKPASTRSKKKTKN